MTYPLAPSAGVISGGAAAGGIRAGTGSGACGAGVFREDSDVTEPLLSRPHAPLLVYSGAMVESRREPRRSHAGFTAVLEI